MEQSFESSTTHSNLTPINETEHYTAEKIQHDLNLQLKNKETYYAIRTWVIPKLNQIRTTSSLSMQTSALPETLNVTRNVLSMSIMDKVNTTTIIDLHFFEGGIVKLNCINPAKPSQFSFELIDKPANLAPCDLKDKIVMNNTEVQVSMIEVQAKIVVKFSPFAVILLSTRNEQEEVLFEMNTNKSLRFDEHLTADFTFNTEYLYGLPERSTGFLLEDTKTDMPYRLYNRGIYAYPLGSKDCLYGSVPVIVSRRKNSSSLVSMFWQNTSETYVDIHKNAGSTSTFWLSERGNLECYIFVSHDNKTHFKSLSNVLGYCAMPQYFSLGYHQCRWSYEDQEDILNVNENFNKYKIPCDSITLDIDHTDGYRYFTWDEQLYPDVPGMEKKIVSDGRQIVTIADPHLKIDNNYRVFKEFLDKELYIKTKDNKPLVGECWPGSCVWIDFLNEEARECWASQYRYDKYKYSTPNVWAWNDMNEPHLFDTEGSHMPVENIQTFKSKEYPEKVFQVEHREVCNIYGYTQHKATYDGMVKRNKDHNIRPHILNRSFFAGSQKYTAVWTGDTGTTWGYLRLTVAQLLSLSICGISNAGADVGGFAGDPEVELAVRWYQLGTFMPYFRGHSALGTQRREPWLYPEKYVEIIRESIIERYRLLAYLYTTFEEHCRTGVPIWRPVWFDQESVFNEGNMKDEERFMVGEGILVVPVLEKGVGSLKGVLKGVEGRWYDYFSKEEVVNGEQEINIGLERIGCFVKGGCVIPIFDVHTGIKSSKDARESNVVLFVALDEEGSSKGEIYFDDGETFDYRNGGFVRSSIEFGKDTLMWNCHQSANGYKTNSKITKAVIAGSNNKFQKVYFIEEGNNHKQEIRMIKEANCLVAEFSAFACKNWKIIFE